jgi:hypothetical protein
MNFSSKIFLLFTILLLSSCSLFIEPMPESWNWGFKPRPLTGVRGFPPADTEYGKGFKDGCHAAWDSTTTGMTGDLQAKYDYKRMQKSGDYDNGWWDGMEQCVYIMDWDVL